MRRSDIVYLGIKGTVLALDRHSGARLWETKLKGQGFVTLLVEKDRVLAATHGEVFCLDAQHGTVLWHDPLRGYGYGLVSLASERGSVSPTVAREEEARRHAAAAAATHSAAT